MHSTINREEPNEPILGDPLKNWKNYQELVDGGELEPASEILIVSFDYQSERKPSIQIEGAVIKNGYAPTAKSGDEEHQIEIISFDGRVLKRAGVSKHDDPAGPVPEPGKSYKLVPLESRKLKKSKFAMVFLWQNDFSKAVLKDKNGEVISSIDLSGVQRVNNVPNFKSIRADQLLKLKKKDKTGKFFDWNKNKFNLLEDAFSTLIERAEANGTNNTFDIVMLRDQFPSTSTYENYAEQVLNYLVTLVPFSNFADKIRFTIVANTESLNCDNYEPSTPRYFTCNYENAIQAATSSGAPFDRVGVIIGTNEYGGSAVGPIAAITLNSYYMPMFAHELAHTLTLQDEYLFSNSDGPLYQDVFVNCYHGTPPAQEWAGIVGSNSYYANCSLRNWYRSAELSIMNSYSVLQFNEVSKRVLTRELGRYTVANQPPYIIQQPKSINRQSGQAGIVKVIAGGSGDLRVNWRKNGALAGFNMTIWQFASLRVSDSGTYQAVVENDFGTAVSNTVTISVAGPPEIEVHPNLTNPYVLVGSNFTLSVTPFAPDTPHSYKWTKDGVEIPGAIQRTLTINNAQTSNGGVYRAIVTNSLGTTVSNGALVYVGAPPVITSQPVSRTVEAGTELYFQVSFVGTGPNTFQWYRNNVALAGSTMVYHSIANAQPANAGTYHVVITSPFGSAQSAPATLTIGTIPVITMQPISQTVLVGANVTFQVQASGGGALTYQWRRNGANISGATSTTLSLPNVQNSNAGEYSVVVQNAIGSVTSNVATLTVGTIPTITTQPMPQSIATGSSATFTVAATGTAPLTYQWRRNGTKLAGATNSTLTIPNVQSSNAGAYSVVVQNAFGSRTSNNANLVVGDAPSITSQPTPVSIVAGSNVTFSVTATGSPTLTYQWRRNGTNLAGATNRTLMLNNVQPTNAGAYTVVIQNVFGSTTSASANLVVGLAPAIVSQPNPIEMSENSRSSVLSVTSTGTAPLRYQWFKDNQPLSMQTNASLDLSSLGPLAIGVYKVSVTNDYGTIMSQEALVKWKLFDPPGPGDLTVLPVDQSDISFEGGLIDSQ